MPIKIDVQFYVDALKGCSSVFYDQGVLNVCFAQQSVILKTCKYNFRLSYDIPDFFNRDNKYKNEKRLYCSYNTRAKIYHYCGYTGTKPWHFLFNERDIKNADDAFLSFVPEVYNFYSVWWKYVRFIPSKYRSEIINSATMNTAVYRVFHQIAFARPYTLQDFLKLETLTPPIWDSRHNLDKNMSVNECVIPKVFICDAATKKNYCRSARRFL